MRRFLLLTVLSLAWLPWAGLPADAQQAPAQPAIPVSSEPARVGDVAVEVTANGTVVAESVVTIRPRVDGQIQRVHVTEGQMVQRGQPLFTLDARINQALLAQQEAQLAALRAQATRTQADAVRYQALRGEGFTAAQRFEQAQADAATAAANARATEALIQQTRLNIEFASITAEADGKLGALPLRVGNFVRLAEATPLGTITQMDPILVQFAVPERWLPQLRTAMSGGAVPVQATPDGDGAATSRGQLVFIDSAVDTQTGTIQLRARFANAEGQLWPGQYVRVQMAPATERNAITVPSASVQTGQQGRFVFVISPEGTAKRRPVELVRSLRDRAVVRGEIADGERVIVDGAQRVSDGSRVADRTPQRVSAAN
jgi:multidrug efflux system membrane fusion protein